MALAQAAALPAGKDMAALLERMKANQKTNNKLAQQYTSTMLWHNRNFEKNGKTTIDETTRLFDNRAVRREMAGGGETPVVESMPPGLIAEKLNDDHHELKGTTIQLDFARLADEPGKGSSSPQAVWLEKEFKSEYTIKILLIKVHGITEQSWSDFKRFHVDIRLLPDTMRTVEEQKSREGGAQNP